MLRIEEEIFPVFDKVLLEKFLHFNAVKTSSLKEQGETFYTFEEISKIATDVMMDEDGPDIQKAGVGNFAKSYFVHIPSGFDFNFKIAIEQILAQSKLEFVTVEHNVNLEGFAASLIIDGNIVVMNYQNSLAIEVLNDVRSNAFEVIDFNILACLKDRICENTEVEDPSMVDASLTRVYSLSYLTADLSDIIVQLKEKYDT